MARGFNSHGDIVKKTTDGRDLKDLWNEFQTVVQMRNQARDAIESLFTFRTTLSFDEVLQAVVADDFEIASEFGEPVGIRAGGVKVPLGFGLEFYDTATRYTWKFMLDASEAQLVAIHNQVLEGDARMLYRNILKGLLLKPASIGARPVNENGVAILPLWDGETDSTPPEYAGQTFAAGHQHYLTSGATTIDGGDLATLINHVAHHGYGIDNGSRIVIMCHPTEGDQIRGFRAGVASSPYDFISSPGGPAYLTNMNIVGQTPPAEYAGLPVIGSFGNAWVIQSYFWPVGYVAAVASAGPNSPSNPLAFREHPRTEYQGLRQIGGPSNDYPLAESFYSRAFGTGVRNRGAAAVMQMTASGSYSNPTIV